MPFALAMNRDQPLVATMKQKVRRRVLILTACLWGLQLSVIVLVSSLDRGETLFFFLGHLASTAFGILLCCLIYLVLERLHAQPFRRQATAVAVLATVAAVMLAVVRLTAHREIGRQGADMTFRLADYLGVANAFLFFFLAWAAIVIALIYSFRVQLEQTMRVEAQSAAHRAQMQALHYQINPHFLFNTLNSIAALVLDNQPQAAERMIRKIADFLRSGLASDPFDDVSLRSEVEQQSVYLDIERVRFSDRLAVEIEVPEELSDAIVPSFILQPLIENAIKHAVAPSRERTTIRIEVDAENGWLSITVSDDGAVGPDEGRSGMGIGLKNVEQRLAARYGDQYSFHAGPRRRGFAVHIRLPLQIAG